MKLFLFLLLTIMICSCQNYYKNSRQYLLSSDTIKYWNAISKKGAWGCIAYTKHGTWGMYDYNKSGKLRAMKNGDVMRSHTYKLRLAVCTTQPLVQDYTLSELTPPPVNKH